jgi:hypothetical protein
VESDVAMRTLRLLEGVDLLRMGPALPIHQAGMAAVRATADLRGIGFQVLAAVRAGDDKKVRRGPLAIVVDLEQGIQIQPAIVLHPALEVDGKLPGTPGTFHFHGWDKAQQTLEGGEWVGLLHGKGKSTHRTGDSSKRVSMPAPFTFCPTEEVSRKK